MTVDQLAKELHELKRRRETPLPLIEMFDALLSLAPGLSANRGASDPTRSWLLHCNGWNARTPDRSRRLAWAPAPQLTLFLRGKPGSNREIATEPT
jgi:hypothetical protein